MALDMLRNSPWAVSAALLSKSKILYVRSESDRDRFKKISKRVERKRNENLKSVFAEFNSIFSLIELMEISKERDDLVSARWAAWRLINKSVIDLSKINNIYLTKNWGSNLEEVFDFSILPDNYKNNVEILCTSSNYDEIITAGRNLTRDLRDLIFSKQITSGGMELKTALCKEIVSMTEYINKIRTACHKKDIFAASYAATELQVWISEVLAKQEFEVTNLSSFNLYNEIKSLYEKYGFPNLSEGISKQDFRKINDKVNELEKQLTEYCTQLKYEIPRLNNLDEIKLLLNGVEK